MKKLTYVAITINSLLILWAFIFLKYTYIGIILGIFAIIWFFVFLKKKQDKLEVNFQERFSGKNIRYLDKYAIYRAQESHGYSQRQGRGYLVLTDDGLYLEMVLLNMVLPIPITSITKVGQTSRILGVNPGRPMLKIEFKDSRGNNDSIGISVKNLATWEKEITAVMNEHF